jgi:four helix bundle protein
MFHFRTLDVYRCAVAFLPMAYALAKGLDGEMANQLRRAALSISLNIAEGTGRYDRDQRKHFIIAKGSAFECAAVLDGMRALGTQDVDGAIARGDELLLRIVSMLTKLIG